MPNNISLHITISESSSLGAINASFLLTKKFIIFDVILLTSSLSSPYSGPPKAVLTKRRVTGRGLGENRKNMVSLRLTVVIRDMNGSARSKKVSKKSWQVTQNWGQRWFQNIDQCPLMMQLMPYFSSVLTTWVFHVKCWAPVNVKIDYTEMLLRSFWYAMECFQLCLPHDVVLINVFYF